MPWYEILTVTHVVAAAVGVGAATAADSVFLGAIRNRRVNHDQFVLVKASSHVVLAGLSLLVITGVILFLQDLELWEMPHFQAKMTAIIILMINGFVFHGTIVPFFEEHRHTKLSEESVASRQWLFAATGAISAVSWFAALILAVVGDVELGYMVLIGIYIALIVLGTGFGYLLLSHLLFWSEDEEEPRARRDHQPTGKKWSLVVLAVLLVVLVASLAVAIV